MEVTLGIYTAPETRAHWFGWIAPPLDGKYDGGAMTFIDAEGGLHVYRSPRGSDPTISPPEPPTHVNGDPLKLDTAGVLQALQLMEYGDAVKG